MAITKQALKEKLEDVNKLREQALELNQRLKTAKTERAKQTIEQKLETAVKDIAIARLLMLPQTKSLEVQQNNLELLKQLEKLRIQGKLKTPEFQQAQERLKERMLDLKKQQYLSPRKVQKKLFRR